jgi:hypothetical protein
MMEHKVQHIAITMDDGSVAVMQFVLDPRLPAGARLPGLDEAAGTREASDEAIQHEIDRSAFTPRTPVSWRRMDRSEYPEDRTFRDAWHDPDGKGQLAVHMPKAREIHRDRLRELRTPMLERLDIAYMYADEQGDTKAKVAIAAVKQKLRDITQHPAIEAASTPGELKAATLDTLKV